jgi:hypothetical protein
MASLKDPYPAMVSKPQQQIRLSLKPLDMPLPGLRSPPPANEIPEIKAE